MKLCFKLLDSVSSVNDFEETLKLDLVAGNPGTVYFRLINKDKDSEQRYIPASGATVAVKFNHIDSNKVISRVAANPFVDDKSIWSIPIQVSDAIATGTMEVTLTEGAVARKLVPLSDLSQEPVDGKRFYA
jgi:hypothetical protein